MNQIDLKSASVAELREYARDSLGLSVPAKMQDRGKLLALIIDNWVETDVPPTMPGVQQAPQLDGDSVQEGQVITEQMDSMPGKQKSATAVRDSGKPRYTIMISPSGNPHEVNPVPVSINGRQYLMNRGEECEVPPEVVEALNHAVEIQYEDRVDPRDPTLITRIERRALRFPFQIIKFPQPIAA